MSILIRLSIVAPLLLATPALAQDFLAPLEEMVDALTGAPAPKKPMPRAAPKTVEAPPPIPRPRPPALHDEPVVAAPTLPEGATAAEAPDETPEAKIEPGRVSAPEAIAVPEVAPDEPERVYQAACPAVIMGLVEAEIAAPLSDGICGEQSPLVVTAVLSRGRMVPLSSPITTNCQMASALPRWVEAVDGYASAMLESPLASVDTGTSYMCRNRNNAEGGFTSEHGFANAIDVTGFTLEDGRSIAVDADWAPADAVEARLLRLAHDAACGGFMTVLGPEANAEHHDHLHLDLGCHGKSCTAQICE